MNFKACLAIIAATTLLCGCVSLPEGSKKPELHIDSVNIAQNEGVNGFNVLFRIKHNSLSPLDVQKILTSVRLNGKAVAMAEEKPSELKLEPRREKSITCFVPSNLATAVADKSMQYPLFYGQAECDVKVVFTTDPEDPFNPEQKGTFIIKIGRAHV